MKVFAGRELLDPIRIINIWFHHYIIWTQNSGFWNRFHSLMNCRSLSSFASVCSSEMIIWAYLEVCIQYLEQHLLDLVVLSIITLSTISTRGSIVSRWFSRKAAAIYVPMSRTCGCLLTQILPHTHVFFPWFLKKFSAKQMVEKWYLIITNFSFLRLIMRLRISPFAY